MKQDSGTMADRSYVAISSLCIVTAVIMLTRLLYVNTIIPKIGPMRGCRQCVVNVVKKEKNHFIRA